MNHRAERASRSPQTCFVVRRRPSIRERSRLNHASATPERTKKSSRSIRKSKTGLCSRPVEKYLKKTCACRGDVAEAQVGNRLDPSHGDEQEPAEGQRHVHVSEQRIDAEDPAMQQRLADDLPEGRQGVARGKPAQDPQLVGMRKLPEPRPPLPRKGEEHHGGTDYEGYAERSKEIHRQRSPQFTFDEQQHHAARIDATRADQTALAAEHAFVHLLVGSLVLRRGGRAYGPCGN